MRKLSMLGAISLTLAPIPALAQAQDHVRIGMGEEASFTIDAQGATIAAPKAAGSSTPYEAAMGVEFSRGQHDDAMGPNGKPMKNDGIRPPAPVPSADNIRVRFTKVPGNNNSMLVIENGYRGALVYRATIFLPAASPTDVCLVMPGKVGVEHWPYAIQAIEMREIKLIPWTPEIGLRCE